MNPDPTVRVLVASGQLEDDRTAREIVQRAADAAGVSAELTVVPDVAAWRVHLAQEGSGGTVVWPDPATDVAALVGDRSPDAGPLVRFDAGLRAPDRCPALRRHVRGRGLAGLGFAVAAVRAAAPGSVHRYGSHPDQRAELRLPPGPVPEGGVPVVVLVHGGYWRAQWESDLMEPLAADLGRRGFATWNLEYRRPSEVDGAGAPRVDAGWDGTAADVADGFAALADAVREGAPLDLSRVAVVGHSAGGQLAVRLAADLAGSGGVVPAATVSLAGVLDLVAGHSRGVGNGAVESALGGPPGQRARRYRASSPRHRVPIGSPLLVVCGTEDDPDLLDVSRAFAVAASAAGDDVEVIEAAGDHFAVIDPTSNIWARTAGVLAAALDPLRLAPSGPEEVSDEVGDARTP